jgi:hypothetical protein
MPMTTRKAWPSSLISVSMFRSVGWEPGTSSSPAVSSAPFGTSLLGTKCFADFFLSPKKTDVRPNRRPFTEEVADFRTCGNTELVTGRVLRLVLQILRGTGTHRWGGWTNLPNLTHFTLSYVTFCTLSSFHISRQFNIVQTLQK